MQINYKNIKIFLKILEDVQVRKEELISSNKNYLILGFSLIIRI